ncbi:hypothetical protein [Helicobacter suis]|uniref:hypothetical protein n=2 Tax=Helicobacter suis TaxID=104628 RepID=UPI00117A86CC|nr:hypothetical protein [Helicobacter suis]
MDHFNVKMDMGVSFYGEEQRERDTSWYSELKLGSESFYWNRLKKYLEDRYAPKVVKPIDEDTDSIMNRIGDPRQSSEGVYGMVVGAVQSGKTSNYACLINKAVDAGYKFIVILAWDKENVRGQTQRRINEMFVGKDSAGKLIGVGKVSTEKPHPVSLVTEEDDFKSKDVKKAIQLIDLTTKIPYVLVVKKHEDVLSSIAKIFSTYKEKISEHAMLLIDDESDYGSIDINKAHEEEPSAINKGIRGLLNCFKKYSYIAYTATPFANIFIDFKLEKGKLPDLFPKNFIHFLRPPTNYCGLQEVFKKSPGNFLVNISDYESAFPIEHGKNHKVPYLPASLLEAVHVFCLNIAIRHLRKQKEHNSMLVKCYSL